MQTTTERITRPEDRFLAAFEVHAGHARNGSNPRVHELRREALTHFARLGFPARKAEAWKYTNIGRKLAHAYALGASAPALTPDDLAPYAIPGLDAARAVLVNGRFEAGLSSLDGLPEGVVVTGLAEAAGTYPELFDRHFARYADYRGEVFTALNTAFTHDGLFVYVPKNTVVERPIHVLSLLHTDADLFLQPRLLVVVERSAQVRLIESRHARTGTKTFTNGVTELFAGPNAHVDLFTLQDEGDAAAQVASLYAYQEADSYLATSTITLSGDLVRNTQNYLPDAENCETHLRGLFLGQGSMHVDNHTLVDHAKPHCFSNELFKGILADRATGVFNGKVFVRPDAQQTNAYQENKTVLLSDAARMYAKPELEIYADDVKCSHGATTGQLDAEAMFYLRSRGLTEGQARRMLLLAFARDVIDEIAVEPLRAYLDHLIEARLT
ncbi:Fe-S cluster assembly protein SufD [Rhodocaloribacter sp.]